MNLQPNKFGKFKKEDVKKAGYRIFDAGVTYSEVKEIVEGTLNQEERLSLCEGFVCKREWRGCVPVYDVFKVSKYIDERDENGKA